MSRIGREPVVIPAGATVTVADGNVVTVKGPLGELQNSFAKELTIKVEDGKVLVTPEKIGYYQAAAIREDTRSAPVEFCIVDAKVTTDKAEYSETEPIRPAFSCAAAEDELRGWVVKTDAYAKYWGYPVSDEGVIPGEATLPAGKYLVIGLYRNRYGIYSTPPCFFAVTK